MGLAKINFFPNKKFLDFCELQVNTRSPIPAKDKILSSCRFDWGSGFSGLTADKSGFVTNGDGNSGYFGLDAEL